MEGAFESLSFIGKDFMCSMYPLGTKTTQRNIPTKKPINRRREMIG
jgi:hypothetical protein